MEQLNLLTQDGFDAECEQAWEAYDSTCRATADKPHEHRFDGSTFEPTKDGKRLNTQLYKVFSYMRDSKWHTLREVAQSVGGSESGVSARLRDFRKERFGGHTVERRRVDGGLFEYRLVANGELR
jgi:hypothetical protein